MEKILWVKFGWSDYYRGGVVDGNFSWLAGEGRKGHEAFNFEPTPDGTYYCYVPPQGGGHAPSHRDPNGWTVICLAKHPKRSGIHVVGWYEDATLLGEWKAAPKERSKVSVTGTDPGYGWEYCITSKKAHFIPPEARTLPFSHPSVKQGKYSFLSGPQVQQTENKRQVLKILNDRLDRLRPYATVNPTTEKLPDPGADGADPLGGFGTPEHRKKVEKAAEKVVIEHFEADGFECVDVTKKNLGYDFLFRKRGSELHVEVKGTSGDIPRFFFTRNEEAYRSNPHWRFAIVTHALSDQPRLHVMTNREFSQTFDLEPYVYTGLPVIAPEKN